jgi:hypothetical protein
MSRVDFSMPMPQKLAIITSLQFSANMSTCPTPRAIHPNATLHFFIPYNQERQYYPTTRPDEHTPTSSQADTVCVRGYSNDTTPAPQSRASFVSFNDHINRSSTSIAPLPGYPRPDVRCKLLPRRLFNFQCGITQRCAPRTCCHYSFPCFTHVYGLSSFDDSY